MPWSVGLFNQLLESHISKLEPTNILDVGCGSGSYSDMFKRVAPDAVLEAVEPTDKYVTEYDLINKYHLLYKMPIQEFTKLDNKIYDVVVCFDILEHLYLSEAIDTIECLTYCSRNIIIAWPTNVNQGNHEGNPYEKHKSNMTLSDLTRFDITHYQKVPLDYNSMYHYACIKGIHGQYSSIV
jgi:SAM-dependent methyltransferase